jgi:dipeptidyl aminopeptidase/acylaminoacyl peptidase
MASVRRVCGWIAVSTLAAGGALGLAGGIILCESALHVPRIPNPAIPSGGRAVEIMAQDGAHLRAWVFAPKISNGNCVLLLHGVADSRASQIGLARLLLENHYAVLVPDSRGHGESGGSIVTYGVLEADDIHRWVDWIEATGHPRNVFGVGASLGAGILLQSLAVEHRFRAVVAESPFANLKHVSVDRVAQRLPVPTWLGNAIATPLVWSGFVYARWKYGVNLWRASPENTLSGSLTPVLLIHGLDDTNIYPEHSRTLAARNPRYVELWLVPGAQHMTVYRTAPEQYESKLLAWFAAHTRQSGSL